VCGEWGSAGPTMMILSTTVFYKRCSTGMEDAIKDTCPRLLKTNGSGGFDAISDVEDQDKVAARTVEQASTGLVDGCTDAAV
jgi:hypothetical protein